MCSSDLGLSDTVSKTSAGAVFHTPVAKVTNLATAIAYLKKQGVFVYGADMGGQPCFETDFSGPAALVVGSEGQGLSRLVRESCDVIVSIPQKGQVNSLNASVAAGILLFEMAKNR